LRLLLDTEAIIAAFDDDWNTALHSASSKGRAEVIRLLLERGADVRPGNKDGEYTITSSYFLTKTQSLWRGQKIDALCYITLHLLNETSRPNFCWSNVKTVLILVIFMIVFHFSGLPLGA
jgi:hypothetical protein